MAARNRSRKSALSPRQPVTIATFQYQADSNSGVVSVAMDPDRARRALQFVTLLAAIGISPQDAFREAFEK